MALDFRPLALTNYGHFTSMRAEEGRVRGLDLHLDRLRGDCRRLFGVDLDVDTIRDLCRREAAAHGVAVVRVTVFDPGLDMTHPGGACKPGAVVTARAAAELPAPPIHVQATRYMRDTPAAKHCGLHATIYLRRQAQLAAYDDVLFLDEDDQVYEGGTWNLGFIAGDQVIWTKGPFLPGVTMRLLQKAYPSVSAYVPRSELAGMDVAFATNANVGVRLIRSIDDLEFAETHPVVDQMREAYAAIPMDEL